MPHRGADPALAPALRAQVPLLAGYLSGLGAADLEPPANLPGWTVRDLLVHLGGAAEAFLAAWSAQRPPGGTPVLSLAGYLSGYAAAAGEISERVRSAAVGVGPAEASATFVAGWGELVALLPQVEAAPHEVLAARRGPVRARDLLRTRLLELVVHARDLAASLPGRPAPRLDDAAVAVAVRALTGVLAERHPGRSVELRVPPYAAVQCLGGPGHTRGTPPNVVETDPLTFLDLAAGRVAFGAACADGSVRASGTRSDLSGALPLLG